jgi:type IV pilus assembly protein PilM
MFGLKFGGKSKKGIGIEITSEKVNLVQLRRKGQSSYKLVTYGSFLKVLLKKDVFSTL